VIGGERQPQAADQGTAQQQPARNPGREQVAGVVNPARQHPGQLRDVRGQVDDDDDHPDKERQVVQPAPGPLPGPSMTSMIPVPRTATVVKMTNGPVTRCNGAGGPFRT